eukprot:gb/GECG01002101.1/.p1 GENE.gb/GECG01002101.1/~~gb/GECG01002101.1/.p1  ORF type:complete len:819 (+),score=98.42 gb/GECG01002101.1/:1-2457(+)
MASTSPLLFRLDIGISENQREILDVYSGIDPHDAAHRFAVAHGLSEDIESKLATMIHERLRLHYAEKGRSDFSPASSASQKSSSRGPKANLERSNDSGNSRADQRATSARSANTPDHVEESDDRQEDTEQLLNGSATTMESFHRHDSSEDDSSRSTARRLSLSSNVVGEAVPETSFQSHNLETPSMGTAHPEIVEEEKIEKKQVPFAAGSDSARTVQEPIAGEEEDTESMKAILDLSGKNLTDCRLLPLLKEFLEECYSMVSLERNKLSLFPPGIDSQGSESDICLRTPLANKLQMLNMSRNSLRGISLEAFPSLKTLYLNHNSLSDLSGLHVCSNLSHLFLAHNDLEEVFGLEELVNLKVLDISYNHIESVDGINCLAVNKNLQTLRMHGNPICTRITPAKYRALVLNKLPQVRTLDGFKREDGREDSTKEEANTDGNEEDSNAGVAILQSQVRDSADKAAEGKTEPFPKAGFGQLPSEQQSSTPQESARQLAETIFFCTPSNKTSTNGSALSGIVPAEHASKYAAKELAESIVNSGKYSRSKSATGRATTRPVSLATEETNSYTAKFNKARRRTPSFPESQSLAGSHSSSRRYRSLSASRQAEQDRLRTRGWSPRQERVQRVREEIDPDLLEKMSRTQRTDAEKSGKSTFTRTTRSTTRSRAPRFRTEQRSLSRSRFYPADRQSKDELPAFRKPFDDLSTSAMTNEKWKSMLRRDRVGRRRIPKHVDSENRAHPDRAHMFSDFQPELFRRNPPSMQQNTENTRDRSSSQPVQDIIKALIAGKKAALDKLQSRRPSASSDNATAYRNYLSKSLSGVA